MSWIRLVAGPKSSSSWLILAQYIRKLGGCGFFEGSGARAQGIPFFLKKNACFFFAILKFHLRFLDGGGRKCGV